MLWFCVGTKAYNLHLLKDYIPNWNKWNWSECLCHLNKHPYFDLPKCQNWEEYHCSTLSLVVLTTNTLTTIQDTDIWQMNRAKKLFSQVLSRWRKTVKKQNRFESPKYYETRMRMKKKKKEKRHLKMQAREHVCFGLTWRNHPKNVKNIYWRLKILFHLQGK